MATVTTAAINEAKFCALLNGKYHADREAFLDSWDRLITFGVLAAGATAFLDVFGVHFQKLGAASLALFALVQLVYGLPVKARKHAFLRERYFEISSRLANGDLKAAAANGSMLNLAGQEDPPYFAVHAIAENWATRAVYGDKKPLPCKIGLFRFGS